jgi:virulence factor Mce-like protein
MIAGATTVAVLTGIVVLAVEMFHGVFVPSTPVTVVSARAGLVMNPDAKVKLHGVEVGRVATIGPRPDGGAVLHLALNPKWLGLIPANVDAHIVSSTVFGAKFVELVVPHSPSRDVIRAGQVLDADHVTVENNTVFQQLSDVLAEVDPGKLNATLTAVASGLSGRGDKMAKAVGDFDALLTTVEPSLPTLDHELDVTPIAAGAYADSADDTVATMRNLTAVSKTIVDTQHQLDEFLISTVGLADMGEDVVGSNRDQLSSVVHLLAPTTDLTNKYGPALTCGLAGVLPLAKSPPPPLPGSITMIGFILGNERYRYPANLPKVAATGGSQCTDLPHVPPGKRTPYVVTDVNANPWQYGNQGILLNSDGLKQLLFGPIDGPPRNTAQVGQPG